MRERGEVGTPDDGEIRNGRGETAKEYMDKLAEDGTLPKEVADSAARAADTLARVVKLAEEVLADPSNDEKSRAYSDALVNALAGDQRDALNLLGAGVMAIVVLNKFGGSPKFKL